jgi:hypothetical protein
MQNFQDEFEDQLEELKKSVATSQNLLASKPDASEIAKVYEQFKRFAEYPDLKKLHGILSQDMTKLEQKVLENQKNIKNFD